MESIFHFETAVSISRLAQMIKDQLPAKDRQQLVSLLQEEDETSKEQILSQLKEDYIALQNGTLKTRPLKDILGDL